MFRMLSVYQLMIFDFYNIPLSTVKNLMPKSFDKEKYMLHYQSLQLYLILGLKPTKYIVY